MAEHVVASRNTYEGDWHLYFGCENLHICVNEAASAAVTWPTRQWAVFTRHPPAPWSSGSPRYLFGLSDSQLYERKYGQPMPLHNAAGTLVSVLDRSALVE